MIMDILSNEFIGAKTIELHYNLSYGDIMGEADILVGRTLIEIKTSRECIATVRNLLQTIMYCHLLKKKGINVDKVILLNPTLGETYTVCIMDTHAVYTEITKQN
jgi:CRISPR/Cas system-associated exonuclease Cas4 (RecB family)